MTIFLAFCDHEVPEFINCRIGYLMLNVLSLPDEMLISVFKFLKFETVTQLRKINDRIDKVTVRYGLSKPRIYSLDVRKDTLSVGYRVAEIHDRQPRKHIGCSVIIGYNKLPCSNIPQMIKSKLKKICDVERIIIDSLDIDNKWLIMLNEVDQKYRNRVTFMNCNYKVSVEDLKKVAIKWNVAEFDFNTKNTIFGDIFASDKVLLSLLPQAIIYCETSKTVETFRFVTDETLRNLQRSLPNTFHIGDHYASFTVPEVVRTISAIMKYRGKQFKKWNLGRVFCNTLEELLEADLALGLLEGVTIEKNSCQLVISARNDYCVCTVRVCCFPRWI